MKINVKRLTEDSKLITKSRNDDEGYDIYASETIAIPISGTKKVSTGIAVSVEGDYWLQVEGRSGMASRGIYPTGGVIDKGYSGEIGVMLVNNSGSGYIVNKGDKIAQLVIRKHYHAEIVEVEDLEESDRGEKGFGSSGV